MNCSSRATGGTNPGLTEMLRPGGECSTVISCMRSTGAHIVLGGGSWGGAKVPTSEVGRDVHGADL